MTIHSTIQHWQRIGHEVGMVRFSSSEAALRRFPHGVPKGNTPIGTDEAELLCIEDATGEVLEFDHEVPNRICCRCATSQAHLIEALTILEHYFSRCVESDDFAADQT